MYLDELHQDELVQVQDASWAWDQETPAWSGWRSTRIGIWSYRVRPKINEIYIVVRGSRVFRADDFRQGALIHGTLEKGREVHATRIKAVTDGWREQNGVAIPIGLAQAGQAA